MTFPKRLDFLLAKRFDFLLAGPMLQLRNETPFKATIALFPDEDGVDTLYIVVRATLAIAGASLGVAQTQRPIQLTDDYWGEPGHSSLKRPSDLHLCKPTTDVLLTGEAWAPRGHQASQVDVALSIGSVRKTIRVFGDREWKGMLGEHISSPIPFRRMPLVYERAFGGVLEVDPDTKETVLEPRNPVGVGFARSRRGGGITAHRLPNLEDPAYLIQRPTDRAPPAGFGAVAASWEPRRSHAGTYDEAWRKTRAPYLPKDFNPRFFCLAPPDLICPRYLKGDEPVEILNASPVGPLRFRLPLCELDVQVRIAGTIERPPMRLETVEIDTSEDVVGLLWRGAVPCDKKALRAELVHIGLRGLSFDGRAA
ncbi:DUF2169 family type VI secretion system accessory protein [Sorangium sp. So ce1182]|uniref:DUF2169 family type VI secretion system accessory protein n=1 Tax=Sorangium sp. So ce1182 TaxID=3133334 RepID=UPI003F5FB077